MKKVCVVTATRAEYGHLKPLIRQIACDPNLQLRLIATGTHLEAEYGDTWKEIEADGFKIDRKVPIICGDDRIGVLNTMSRAASGIGRALMELEPDIVVVLGDRYELLSIAGAAMVLQIPVAHISGGEITEGAFDDAFRHAVTKLSHLHFAATEEYRRRIIQMGEEPGNAYNVGDLGVENALNVKLLSREEIDAFLGFKMEDNTLLVTFHPVTNEGPSQEEQFKALLDALKDRPNFKVVFTRPNADTGRDRLNIMLDDFVSQHHDRCRAYKSMGLTRYLTAMSYCAGVIGNSSSGIVEAPSMKVGTINIGNRQKGRLRAPSVIDCPPDKESIKTALDYIISSEFKTTLSMVENPYYCKDTSARIKDIIKERLYLGIETTKHFYDI